MRKIRYSIGERVFDSVNNLFLLLFIITIVFPYVYVIMVSITNQPSLQLMFSARNTLTLEAYRKIFSGDSGLITAFVVSVGRTSVGTCLNLLFTALLAYPISRKYFPAKTHLTVFIVITMLFSGGLIPSYLVISNLKLIDNYWVYIIPGLISAWNCIILRNFFMAIPDSMEESAKIDGASDWRILFQIIIPLALPSLATLALFYAVGHWNSWFDAVVYMRNPQKYTLQVFLRRLVMENVNMKDFTGMEQDDPNKVMTAESIKNATVMVSTLPIIMVYPFLQKYFVKGIMIGALKG
jgi:putative aldouronate transport system permease protein